MTFFEKSLLIPQELLPGRIAIHTGKTRLGPHSRRYTKVTYFLEPTLFFLDPDPTAGLEEALSVPIVPAVFRVRSTLPEGSPPDTS